MGLAAATRPSLMDRRPRLDLRAVQDGARYVLLRLRINRDIFRERGVRHPPPSLDGLGVVFLNWRDPAHPQAGGAEQYAWQLARRIAAGGARTTYLTAAAGDAPRWQNGRRRRRRAAGYRIVGLPGRPGLVGASPSCYRRGRRLSERISFFSPLAVGKHRAVVLVVHHVHQDQFATRFSPAMAAVGRFLEGPVSRLVYRGHTIVAVSPSTRQGVRRRWRFGGPVVIVPSGTPVARGSQLARAEAPTVLFLGWLVPSASGWSPPVAGRRPAEPSLAGPAGWRSALVMGPCPPELEELAHEIGLAGTVCFYGRVDAAHQGRPDLQCVAGRAPVHG